MDLLWNPVAVYPGGMVKFETFVVVVEADGSVTTVPATLIINSDCLDAVEC